MSGQQGGTVGRLLVFRDDHRNTEGLLPDGLPAGIAGTATGGVYAARVGRTQRFQQTVAAQLDGCNALEYGLEETRILRWAW